MSAVRKVAKFLGLGGGWFETSDGDLVAANATTDADWTETLGRKEDTAVHVPGTTASAMAYIKGLMTDNGYVAGKAITSITTQDVWSTDGAIIIRDLIGIVTTVVQTQACNLKITFDPDDGGANVDLAANLAISADAVGTIYRITGDISDALTESLDVCEASAFDVGKGIVLSQAGDILITTSTENTGVIAWYLKYESLGGTVTAAT